MMKTLALRSGMAALALALLLSCIALPCRAAESEEYSLAYITLTTGNVDDAGTGGTVRMRVVGTKGESRSILCDNSLVIDFESGDSDTYVVPYYPSKVGDLTEIKVHLYPDSIFFYEFSNDWYCEEVSYNNKSYPVGQWVKARQTLTVDLAGGSATVADEGDSDFNAFGSTASAFSSGSVQSILIGVIVIAAAAAAVVIVRKRKK